MCFAFKHWISNHERDDNDIFAKNLDTIYNIHDTLQNEFDKDKHNEKTFVDATELKKTSLDKLIEDYEHYLENATREYDKLQDEYQYFIPSFDNVFLGQMIYRKLKRKQALIDKIRFELNRLEHTKKKLVEKASQTQKQLAFTENIIDGLSNIEYITKHESPLLGGGSYKHKYLKYKRKYLLLANKCQ